MCQFALRMLEAQDDNTSSDLWMNQVCLPPEATGPLGQCNPNSLYHALSIDHGADKELRVLFHSQSGIAYCM